MVAAAFGPRFRLRSFASVRFVLFYTMVSAHLHQPVLPSNSKSEDWRLFKRQFENYLLIVDADNVKKLPYLMSCIGGDGFTIYDGLPEPKRSYNDAVWHFEMSFSKRVPVCFYCANNFRGKAGASSGSHHGICLSIAAVAWWVWFSASFFQ